jgi:hypothetical protein
MPGAEVVNQSSRFYIGSASNPIYRLRVPHKTKLIIGKATRMKAFVCGSTNVLQGGGNAYRGKQGILIGKRMSDPLIAISCR